MIGKAKACTGGTTLANYVMKPEKGYELMRYGLSGETPIEIMHQMKLIKDLNNRAKNKFFSLVLSPEKKEGQKLTNAKLREITKEFMNGLGIDPEKQQFIAVVHTEKAHKHIHIIANRIKIDGKAISDKHIGKKAQWIAHKLAKRHGLISAKERQLENLEKLKREEKNLKGVKKAIKRKHDWAMNQNPSSVKQYIKIMDKLGVQVKLVKNKYSGKVQGLRVKDKESGLEFKASEVHRNMSLNKILSTGIPLEQESRIMEILTDEDRINTPEFTQTAVQFLNELAWEMGGQENTDNEYEKRKKRRKKRQGGRARGRGI